MADSARFLPADPADPLSPCTPCNPVRTMATSQCSYAALQSTPPAKTLCECWYLARGSSFQTRPSALLAVCHVQRRSPLKGEPGCTAGCFHSTAGDGDTVVAVERSRFHACNCSGCGSIVNSSFLTLNCSLTAYVCSHFVQRTRDSNLLRGMARDTWHTLPRAKRLPVEGERCVLIMPDRTGKRAYFLLQHSDGVWSPEPVF